MMRRDRLDIVALVDHRLHRAELVQRMQRFAHRVFGETVVLGENFAVRRAHDAGDWRTLGKTPSLHEQFERTVASPASRYSIPARLLARGVAFGPDVEALEQGSPVDIVGERLDRHAGFHPPDIGLGEKQPVERDVARRAEDEFRGLSGHGLSP